MIFTVAIDGPAASGKGTIGRALAHRFGFAHLDTGLLYRAVGAKVLAGGEAVPEAEALQPEDLHAEGLRSADEVFEGEPGLAEQELDLRLVLEAGLRLEDLELLDGAVVLLCPVQTDRQAVSRRRRLLV